MIILKILDNTGLKSSRAKPNTIITKTENPKPAGLSVYMEVRNSALNSPKSQEY